MKRIMSVFLVLSVLITMVFPAVATDNSGNEVTTLVSYDVDEQTKATVKGMEHDSGDVVLYYLENDVLIRTYYVDASEGTATQEDRYGNIREVDMGRMRVSSQSAPQGIPYAGYFNVGSIVYNADRGRNTIDLSYTSTAPEEKTYVVNGVYEDAADLMAVILAWAAVPVGYASKLAGAILAAACAGLTTLDVFVIDSYEVTAMATTVAWRAQNSGTASLTTSFTGTEYVVEGEDLDEVYYDGTYWHPSAFSERNTEFAYSIYEKFWGRESVTIVSWRDYAD